MPPTSIWSSAFNARLLAAALVLGPLLVAVSAWLHRYLQSDHSEIALAGVGYGALALAVGQLSQHESEATRPPPPVRGEAEPDRKALAEIFPMLLKLRPYGLLLTGATLLLSANAIVIAAFAKSPQISLTTQVTVLEILACPNVWAGLFLNSLAFVGWLLLARTAPE